MMQGAVHGNEISRPIELELSRVALDEMEPVAKALFLSKARRLCHVFFESVETEPSERPAATGESAQIPAIAAAKSTTSPPRSLISAKIGTPGQIFSSKKRANVPSSMAPNQGRSVSTCAMTVSPGRSPLRMRLAERRAI